MELSKVSEVKVKEEIKLKTISHKERKEYSKKITDFANSKDEEGIESLMSFREKFLKEHIEGEIDLDELPAVKFDELIKELEGEMDFHMGLRNLISLNTLPSQGKPVIQKQVE